MRPGDRRVPHRRVRPAPLGATTARVLEAALLAALFAYGAVVFAFWALQDRLVFYPPPSAGPATAPEGWRLVPLDEAMGDGASLRGALLLPPGPPRPLVIYLGGNAEEATAYAPDAARTYGDRAVALLNYRGYGASTGRPSERALVEDGRAVLARLAGRPDVEGGRVALHGRSMGTGVAVQIAGNPAVRCLVLTSPFDSARSIAAGLYPWLPVRWLLRHPFDSMAHAVALRSPLLVIAGEADTLVTPAHSRRLAQAWGGPVEWRSFPGRGHGDLSLDPGYAASIRRFLDRHL